MHSFCHCTLHEIYASLLQSTAPSFVPRICSSLAIELSPRWPPSRFVSSPGQAFLPLKGLIRPIVLHSIGSFSLIAGQRSTGQLSGAFKPSTCTFVLPRPRRCMLRSTPRLRLSRDSPDSCTLCTVNRKPSLELNSIPSESLNVRREVS